MTAFDIYSIERRMTMRLIDADKLIENAELRYVNVGARSNGKSILTLAKTWLLNEVDHAPTVEAKPIVHAHWKDIGLETKHRFCTKCGGCVTQRESWVYKYCPCCGAKMDELVSNTDELNNTQKVSVDDVKIP